MKKKLKELISPGITGVSDDSRKITKGGIFVAVKGLNSDGHDYIPEVIKKGVKVIIGERPIRHVSINKSIRYFQVNDSREALGILASQFYGSPSERIKIIGVTGTKGKTTTCHLIYHILKGTGKKVGLLSSICAKIGNNELDTGFHVTSPDCLTLHKLLKEMVDAGCEFGVIEVSSHGIDQKRIAGVKFEIAALTNIAPEHLDYHKKFSEYKRVKLSFLNSAKINVIGKEKTELNILPGKFNNLNAQLAVDIVNKLGIRQKEAVKVLQSFKLPEGRMEEIENNIGIKIYIDFAHTPDSLKEVLTYLKEKIKAMPAARLSAGQGRQGKLISVFGCAGERDKKKRSRMGKISAEIADYSLFTAEDPRRENIFDILSSMRRSVPDGVLTKKCASIPERGEAIIFALSRAKKDDTVVICGKGHEKSMAYDVFEHPWSDKEKVKEFFEGRNDISAIVLAAGKGKRMYSIKPKVLHEICGRSMISYTLENLRSAGIREIVVVVGYRKNDVVKRVSGAVKIGIQKNPAGGTADAAKTGFVNISKKSKTLVVINGDDSAFYKAETIKNILKIHKERERKLTFVSLMKDNPVGLGRVIRGTNGLIKKIIEEKDASEEERKIKEVNDGLYVFDRDWFEKNIDKVKKGQQGEYYLVDLVKMAIDQGDKMATYTLPNDNEWQGINTPEQLEEANRKMTEKLITNN